MNTLVLKKTLLSRPPSRTSFQVALVALAACAAVSMIYWENFLGLAPYLSASWESVVQRQEYWRLFTSIAAHGDMRHLAANSLFFTGLAFMIHAYFGTIAFPVLAIALGALVNFLSLMTYGPRTELVGASGVVYFMAAFWLTLFLFIERRRSIARRALATIGVALILLFPTTFEPRVSYRTHAIGFVIGVLAGAAYFVARRGAIRAAEVHERTEPSEGKDDESGPPESLKQAELLEHGEALLQRRHERGRGILGHS